MGSLMPGWDACLEEKKGEVEPDDVEVKGYFAKLERARSLKHRSPTEKSPFEAALPHARPLERASSGASDDTMEKPGPKPCLPHSETMPVRARGLSRISAPVPGSKLTDWEQELKCLSSTKKKVGMPRKDVPAEHEHEAWWSHLDSSALNRRPDTPIDRAHSAESHVMSMSFTPQQSLVGKMQFRMDKKAAK